MIRTESLVKRFGDKTAVDDLTITVEPGHVTGFLGPNGAGKSTTMRLIMGLEHPTSGCASVNGRPILGHSAPLTEVGALLEAKAFHSQRSARAHLQALAASHHLPSRRADEVLEFAGLAAVADKPAGTFSLGMGQRLGIASALIGDPATVILDEPINGLDPEGVLWVRDTVRGLAAEGRTVFLSSHLMSEMAQTADRLIVIGEGHLLADKPIADVLAWASKPKTRVRSPEAKLIAEEFTLPEAHIEWQSPDILVIAGIESARIGEAAARNGWILHELVPISATLEEAFFDLTEESVEYRSSASSTNDPVRQLV